MQKKTYAGWIITAPWYDEMKPNGHFCGEVERSKLAAIARFRATFTKPKTWRQYRREGWRAVRCTVNWH